MFHNGHGLLCGAGEYCRMVDRDGKQVLLCTWSRRSPTLDFDFQFLEDPESAEKPQVRQVSDVVFNLRSTAVVLSGWITGQPQRSCRGKTQVLQSQSQSLIHYRWLTLFHVWREWWRDERSGFSDFTAASGLVGWLVSIPQSKSWSSPSVGWEGSMCKHFSGCGHAVMHVYTNAVLPTIVIHTNAVFTHHCRRYTCSVTHHCHTYTSTVIHTNAVLPATVIHTNALLPTTVIHTHAVLPATVIHTNALLPTTVIHTHAVLPATVIHTNALLPTTVIHTHAVLPATVICTNALLPTTLIHTHAVLPTTVIHTNALLPTTLIHTHAVLPTTVIHTNALLPTTVIHTDALLPTTVIHTHALLPTTVIHTHALLPTTVTHTHALLPTTVIHTHVLLPTTVIHTNAVLCTTVIHTDALLPTTVIHTDALLPTTVIHINAVLHTIVMHTQAVLPTTVIHTNAVLCTTPAAALQLWGCWWAADSVALCCAIFQEEDNGFKKGASKNAPDYTKPQHPPRFSKHRPPLPKVSHMDVHCTCIKYLRLFLNQYFVIGVVNCRHGCCGEYPVLKASHVSCSTFSGTRNTSVAYFWCSVAMNMTILFGIQFLTSKQHQSCSEYDYYACDTVCGWF